MAEIAIRRARSEELNEIVALVKPMWVLHGTSEPNLLNADYLQGYDTGKYFTPCFETPDQNALYVALSGETVVGCCRVEITELEGMFHAKKAAYVDDLAVHANYQRQGIGARLVQEAEAFARSHGITLLKTRVYDFNTAAQSTFGKTGFRPVYSELYKILD